MSEKPAPFFMLRREGGKEGDREKHPSLFC